MSFKKNLQLTLFVAYKILFEKTKVPVLFLVLLSFEVLDMKLLGLFEKELGSADRLEQYLNSIMNILKSCFLL